MPNSASLASVTSRMTILSENEPSNSLIEDARQKLHDKQSEKHLSPSPLGAHCAHWLILHPGFTPHIQTCHFISDYYSGFAVNKTMLMGRTFPREAKYATARRCDTTSSGFSALVRGRLIRYSEGHEKLGAHLVQRAAHSVLYLHSHNRRASWVRTRNHLSRSLRRYR